MGDDRWRGGGFRVECETLGYHERVGLLEPVDRGGGGQRRYREADLARIRFLSKFRATGMPIRVVQRYAELMKGGEGTHAERLGLFEAHREAVLARLAQTAESLDLIEWKFNFYRQRLERQ